MRHGTCFRRRLAARHAGAAPHSAVAELGVVRRCYPLTMKPATIISLLLCGALLGVASTLGFIHFQRAQRISLARSVTGITRIPPADVTFGSGSSPCHHEYARRVRFDLALVDSAIDQWQVSHSGYASGTPITAKDIAPLLWPGTSLQESCARGQCLDSLGNPIFIFTADIPPSLSRATFERLSSVASMEYWSPYTIR